MRFTSSARMQRALGATVVSATESRSGGGHNVIRFCVMIGGDHSFEGVQLCDAGALCVLMGEGTLV